MDTHPCCEACESGVSTTTLYVVWLPGSLDQANFMCEGCLGNSRTQAYITKHNGVIYKVLMADPVDLTSFGKQN